jgi:hypothetical protein
MPADGIGAAAKIQDFGTCPADSSRTTLSGCRRARKRARCLFLALRVGSLSRTDSVAIEGIADIGEALLPVGATRLTLSGQSASKFAVMHNAPHDVVG